MKKFGLLSMFFMLCSGVLFSETVVEKLADLNKKRFSGKISSDEFFRRKSEILNSYQEKKADRIKMDARQYLDKIATGKSQFISTEEDSPERDEFLCRLTEERAIVPLTLELKIAKDWHALDLLPFPVKIEILYDSTSIFLEKRELRASSSSGMIFDFNTIPGNHTFVVRCHSFSAQKKPFSQDFPLRLELQNSRKESRVVDFFREGNSLQAKLVTPKEYETLRKIRRDQVRGGNTTKGIFSVTPFFFSILGLL